MAVTAWQAFKEEALAHDIAEVALRLSSALRKAGGDLVGRCPAGCAKRDGFVVTKAKRIFLCRPSGESGDVVKMVEHCLDLDFASACEWVNGRARPDRSRDESPEEAAVRAERRARREFERQIAEALEAREAEEKRHREEEAIADVLERSQPILGTQGEAYLIERGAAPPARCLKDVLYCPELDYWGFANEEEARADVKRWLANVPAMVAQVRDAEGAVSAIHQTYLDPSGAPRKWRPIGFDNPDRKFRGSPKGGLMRLGRLTDRVAIGEGLETTFGWYAAYACACGFDDFSIAAAGSIGNLCGKSTGSQQHMTATKDGKPVWIPNGEPDMTSPGVILPDYVTEVILLGDGDSERHATLMKLVTATKRLTAQGKTVVVHMAPNGADWGDVAKLRRRAA
jgi:hypothetical protein